MADVINSNSDAVNEDDVIVAETENVNDESMPVKPKYNRADDELESQVEKTVADGIINTVVETMTSFVRDYDRGNTRKVLRTLLATIMAINEAGEFENSLNVNGERYFYNEYAAPGCLADLVVARRVVARNVNSAKDFLDRKKYHTSYKPVSPSVFAQQLRQLASYLRINAWKDVKKLDRQESATLEAATAFAVNNRRVVSRTQSTIYFLTAVFDEEADVKISEWAKQLALSISDARA